MNGPPEVLQRFHQVLVEEISQKRPEYLGGPFTVAEIYQNLVPYNTHRDRLGIEMNGDYEDALLRLLAGEGGFLLLESEHALLELRQELESSNPNSGLYRDYAAVDVRLGQAASADAGGEISLWDDEAVAAPASTGGPESTSDTAVLDLGPKDQEAEPEAEGAVTGLDVPAPQADPVRNAGEHTHVCSWCRAELPRRNQLHFCPFCGADIQLIPCPGCGEELERDWRFCIACGRETSG